MLDLYLNTNINAAKRAFKTATCENIIVLCEEYLIKLNEFRCELYKFQGTADINLRQENPAQLEKVIDKRQEIYFALTAVVRELNQTNALLRWLTSSNKRETIETFNRVWYRGHKDWDCRGGIVRFGDGDEADQISVHEAVDIAIGLRCEEFVNLAGDEIDIYVNLQNLSCPFSN